VLTAGIRVFTLRSSCGRGTMARMAIEGTSQGAVLREGLRVPHLTLIASGPWDTRLFFGSSEPGQFSASLIFSAHLFLMRRVGGLSQMLSIVGLPRSIDHVRVNRVRLLGAHAQMRERELGRIRKSRHALVPVRAG
jgi:hypothetical protein